MFRHTGFLTTIYLRALSGGQLAAGDGWVWDNRIRNQTTLIAPNADTQTQPLTRRPPLRTTTPAAKVCRFLKRGQSVDQPLVGIIMGSRSDWETMRHAAETLAALGVAHESKVVSAHRTPERMRDYAQSAAKRGLRVIIAGAGGAAHLPGMTAAMTRLPVLGVPVESQALKGMDSLLSIVQMPAGIPVGTLAIGKPGAINAGLLAAAMLATTDDALAARLDAWRAAQTATVADTPE
jgi:5-(carboxyamino)imidazole ribonucleotide mutase